MAVIRRRPRPEPARRCIARRRVDSIWRDRGGFSLTEMVVALAIAVTMTTIVAVATTPQVPAARAAALGESLKNISEAISKFKDNAGFYPSSLTYLTSNVNALGTVTNSCGGTVTIPLVSPNRWTGPYLISLVQSGGIPLGGSTIQTTLVRSPSMPSNGATDFLLTNVVGVDLDVAKVLETTVDAPDGVTNYDLTSGNVRWTDPTNTGQIRGTLTWAIPISSATGSC